MQVTNVVRTLARMLLGRPRTLALGGVLAVCWAATPSSVAAIVTYDADSHRDGLYPTMQHLSPAVVRRGGFGRRFDSELPDHGQVYAQPLLAGGRLVVVTEKDDVYELGPGTGRVLLSRSLGLSWRPTFATPRGHFTCRDLYPDVGITSTPVIDTSGDQGRGVIYLTAKTYAPARHGFNRAQYAIYALRLTDLSNLPTFAHGHPLSLNGISAQNARSVRFDATHQLQRPALLESRGEIYATFGGICDIPPYRGWVMGVGAGSGALVGRWVTPTAYGALGAPIWMAGAGPVADAAGNIFLSTGNGYGAPGHTPTGPRPGNRPPSGLAESVLKLRVAPSGALSVSNFFTPCNAGALDAVDRDLDSGGVVALPDEFGGPRHRPLLLAGGKSAELYLLDRRNLGGVSEGPSTGACPRGGDAAAGTLNPDGAIWGETAVWPGAGGRLFVPTQAPGSSSEGSRGRLVFIEGRLGSLRRVGATGAFWGKGSGSPVVTSIGARSDSAMVWAVSRGVGPATLHVYAAVSPGRKPAQLKSFSVNPFTKFAPPGVGNDEIFVAGAGHVTAFGILP
ncbi:MAG: hypothetical protein DLM64_13025 [Solirubrobacterales bacterium]|nr:MAG: hypothetical protein DLM64_13025 [Solirubrobacterales bacterium]